MNNFEKEFVPYTEALELKQLGFDERTLQAYYKDSGQLLNIGSGNMYDIKAPLYQQAFRWFREKYVLLGFIEPANGYEDKSLFAFYICDDEQNIINDEHSYSKDSSLHFKTYEEAELACLKKLIEIVKQK